MIEEIIDVEQFFKEGKTPPPGKKYRIKIDKTEFVVSEECMTGRQLLELASKLPPNKYQINQKLKGGKVEKIELTQTVCFTTPGIEKFMTLPLDQTEGEPRRQFPLLEEDAEFMESLGLPWETLVFNNGNWVLIHNHPVPKGYNVPTVTIAIKIEPGYPRTQLDMAYFFPALSRADGQPIGALTVELIGTSVFQRWSRHRTPQNPWREGLDNIGTHLELVKFWFLQEFEKRPYAISA